MEKIIEHNATVNIVMNLEEYKEHLKYLQYPYLPITEIEINNNVLQLVIGSYYSGVAKWGVNKGEVVKGRLGWNPDFKTFHLTNNGNEYSVTPIDISTLNYL